MVSSRTRRKSYARRQARYISPIILMLLLQSATIAAQENLPPGPGQSLILEACVQCHDFRAIVSQRKSESDWRRSVNEMIWRGAPLMPGEADLVTRYLARSFGAGQPVRKASQPIAQHDKLVKFLPPGTGRELVVGACVQCHDLAITVMQRKTLEGWRRSVDQMARLGARLNGSEMQLVADYLARSFGPDDPIPEEIKKNPPPVVLPSGARAAPPAGPRAARPHRRSANP